MENIGSYSQVGRNTNVNRFDHGCMKGDFQVFSSKTFTCFSFMLRTIINDVLSLLKFTIDT